MKIADIQDILRFYTNFGPQKPRDYSQGDGKKEGSKMSHFFQAVSQSSPNATDQDIFHKVYGPGKPDAKYHFLKSHCTNFLLDQFLREHINKRIDSELTRGAYIAQKQYVITTLLSKLGSRKAARTLTTRTLRMCKRYQLTSLTIDLLEELRYYAFVEGQIRLFDKYSKEIAGALGTLHDELEIKKLDQSIRVHLSKTIIPTPALRALLGKILSEARVIASQHPPEYFVAARKRAQR